MSLLHCDIDRVRHLLKENRLDEAKTLFVHLCDSYPEDPDVWSRLGTANGHLRLMNGAQQGFHRALTFERQSRIPFSARQGAGISGKLQGCGSLLRGRRAPTARICKGALPSGKCLAGEKRVDGARD